MKNLIAVQLLACSALLAMANVAHAQYVWIDAKGMKQFSDQAPPASIPLKNILKAPRSAAADTGDDFSTKPAATAAPSVAERDADYRKRTKEKAEADAKTATAASNEAAKKANCDAAKVRAAQLQTGKRMRSNTPDNAILDDNARNAKLAEANQALAECK